MSDVPLPLFSVQTADRRPALAVVTRRVYRLSVASSGELARLVPTGEEAGWPLDAGEGNNPSGPDGLARDAFEPVKTSTDVLVQGCAHSSRGPVKMLDTGVRVGRLQKKVRVWGARSIQPQASGRLRLSDPAELTSMPLTWSRAYGGRDLRAEGRGRSGRRRGFSRTDEIAPGTIAYPRNPDGVGFHVTTDPEAVAGCPVPNLEDPEDPVIADRMLARTPLDWLDRPLAASYAPVDVTWFPRVAFWIGVEAEPATRPIHEVRTGVLRAEDLAERSLGTVDRRAFNCAPAGLSGERLTGGERVLLWNLYPGRELLDFALPGERPQLLVSPPGCSVFEIPASLQTVLIEPDEHRVTLTWTGLLEVAAPFDEEACAKTRRRVRWGA